MENFTSNSLSFIDHNDLNWDLLNPIMPINNSSSVQNSIMDYQSLMGFPSDHFITQQSSLIQENFSSVCNDDQPNIAIDPHTISKLYNPELSHGSAITSTRNKRKAKEFAKSSSLNSSSPMSSDGNTKKNNLGRVKRTKTKGKAEDKPNEVVHVRARRGQATDSHSIAERIRRGKINERLRCLQDIVPGCNKTMGMAVMLDEIINYVHSLQNQVEFLSMKLTTASQFHDFNAEIEPHEKMQKLNGSNGNEAQDMQSIITKRGYDHQAVANLFIQPTNWPF